MDSFEIEKHRRILQAIGNFTISFSIADNCITQLMLRCYGLNVHTAVTLAYGMSLTVRLRKLRLALEHYITNDGNTNRALTDFERAQSLRDQLAHWVPFSPLITDHIKLVNFGRDPFVPDKAQKMVSVDEFNDGAEWLIQFAIYLHDCAESLAQKGKIETGPCPTREQLEVLRQRYLQERGDTNPDTP